MDLPITTLPWLFLVFGRLLTIFTIDFLWHGVNIEFFSWIQRDIDFFAPLRGDDHDQLNWLERQELFHTAGLHPNFGVGSHRILTGPDSTILTFRLFYISFTGFTTSLRGGPPPNRPWPGGAINLCCDNTTHSFLVRQTLIGSFQARNHCISNTQQRVWPPIKSPWPCGVYPVVFSSRRPQHLYSGLSSLATQIPDLLSTGGTFDFFEHSDVAPPLCGIGPRSSFTGQVVHFVLYILDKGCCYLRFSKSHSTDQLTRTGFYLHFIILGIICFLSCKQPLPEVPHQTAGSAPGSSQAGWWHPLTFRNFLPQFARTLTSLHKHFGLTLKTFTHLGWAP